MSIYAAAASGDAEQIFKSVSASVDIEWKDLFRTSNVGAGEDDNEDGIKQLVKDMLAITILTPSCFASVTDRERWKYIFHAFELDEEVHIERMLSGFEYFEIDSKLADASEKMQKAARTISKKWLKKQVKALSEKYKYNMTNTLLLRDEETSLELNVYFFSKDYFTQSDEDDEKMSVNEWLEFWSPKTLAEELRRHIVGQEQGIKDACLLLYNHCKRIADPEIKHGGCAFFFGRPGTGKTEIFRWLALLAPRECPVLILDCTAITPPGYKGESIGEIIASNLDSEISSAYRPFIVLDEIDKLFQDTSDSFLQEKAASLLKTIEGHKVTVQREHSKTITIDTALCGFAMAGHCKEVLDLWNRKMKTIGFAGAETAGTCAPAGMTYAEAFGKYGRIPREVLRRIGSYTLLHNLSEQQIMQALLLEDGYVNEALKKARRAGVTISISNDLCESLAAIAAKYQLTLSEIGPALLKAVDYHIYFGDSDDCSIHLEDIRKHLFISEEERHYE